MSSGRVWATSGFVLGVAASVAGNVAHVWHPSEKYLRDHNVTADDFTPEVGAQIAGAFWPIALLITVEVLARVDWPRTFWWMVARFGGAAMVAGVAAVMSYAHLNGLLRAYGEDDMTARLGPLSVDGLMVICGGALLALGHHRKDHPAEGGSGDEIERLPEWVAEALRDRPEPQVTAEVADPWESVPATPGATPPWVALEGGEDTVSATASATASATSEATASATPRATVSATVDATPRTPRKGGTKRAPKGGTKRRTRQQIRVELERRVADLDGDQIQVQPLARELNTSRQIVRELLDEMDVRPIPTAGARQ